MSSRRDCQCPLARHRHGTEQAYISDRCRCAGCRAAHAERAAWRRRQYAYGRDLAHLVPTAGTVRRVEALMSLGWSAVAIAARLDWDPVTVHRVFQQPRLLSTKAAAVAALYDRLWDRPPPETSRGERISAARTRQLARRRGYLPPLAWDDDTIDDPAAQPLAEGHTLELDEVAVQEAMLGRAVTLTRAERNEAVRRLTERGVFASEIGERLHITSRTVQRRRAAA